MSADAKDSPARSAESGTGTETFTEQVAAAVDAAIATDLAPAAAAALLDKADHDGEQISPAMQCIGAGVSLASEGGRIRIQFLFENTTVLPIEMPREAASALARGLLAEVESPMPGG